MNTNLRDESTGPQSAAERVERALAPQLIYFNETLDLALPRERESDQARQIVVAMRAACSGGKRLRPMLAFCAGGIFNVPRESLAGLAVCVELLHSASIVLDDLPSMDDAVLRRGAPPIHRMFDEATAILAANGLIMLAFESLVNKSPNVKNEVLLNLVSDAAKTAGHAGMIGGQHADLTRLRKKNPSRKSVEFVHEHKTGKLFEFAARGAAEIGGASHAEADDMTQFARNLGIAFQLSDDLLAATRTREELGKESRTDTGKAILSTPFDRAWARGAIDRLIDDAKASLARFGARGQNCLDLAESVRERARE
ncbi:MAG: polyprenyl synthetase family protein [Planctomycetes bacterium]|nr:polyprenyl synthetase family protein [Planctomycetota bacterium]